MSESLSSWLALREPADIAARSASLAYAAARMLPRARPLRIVDLGTGTGSNVRYLSTRLPSPQDWLAVDGDAALLAALASQTNVDGAIQTRCINLGPTAPEDIFGGCHLVTASALLDLVSDSWIASLVDRCRANGAVALFALTYNGRSHCVPREPEDDVVRDLMNRHQRMNDKGFGRAAGPDAVDCAARRFGEIGYEVRREASNWTLTPDTRDLQRHLIEGWMEAAIEIAPEQARTIRAWHARRLAHIDANRSHIVVEHEDIAAWPARESS